MAHADVKPAAQWNVDEILADVHRMRGDSSPASRKGDSDDVDLILAELRAHAPPKTAARQPVFNPASSVGLSTTAPKTQSVLHQADVQASTTNIHNTPVIHKSDTQTNRPTQQESASSIHAGETSLPAVKQQVDPVMDTPSVKSSVSGTSRRIMPGEKLPKTFEAPSTSKKRPNTIFDEIKRQAEASRPQNPPVVSEVLYHKKTSSPSVSENKHALTDNEPTRVDIPLTTLASNQEKTRVLSPQSNQRSSNELPGQVPLPGFELPSDSKQHSDEWEQQLRAARSKRVQNFVLSGQEEENSPEENPEFSNDEEVIIDDYESIQDAPVIRADLAARCHAVALRLGITLVVEILLLFLAAHTFFFPQLFSELLTMPIKLVANTVLTVLVVLVNASTIFSGLGGLVRLNVDLDTGAAVSVLATLLHNGVMLCVTDSFVASGLYVYNAAAVLALLCNLWGKHCMVSRIKRNFELVANEKPKKAVTLLENSKGSRDMGHGISIGEPLVCCERDTVTLARYLDHSYVQDPADESAQKLAPYILIAGLAGALIAFFTAPESSLALVHAFTAFSAVSCICVPIASLLGGNLPLRRACRRLEEKQVLLTGYDAVYDFADANVLAVDARDLFPKGTVRLHQLKTFGNQSIDRALLDAAGLAIMANGPLASIFDEIIEGQRSILPEVDTLVYEEKMGISGWVAGNRVLIGNRRLMANHGIAMPSDDLERRLCKYGQFAVYLATHGRLSAVFAVSYHADESIVEALQQAADCGLGIAVYSCDPNITPELIDRLFGVSQHTVSVMGTTGRHAFQQASQPCDPCDASLAHMGGAEGFIDGICTCQRLYRSIGMAKGIQLTLWVLGLVLSLLSIAIKGMGLLSIAVVLGFQVFSIMLVLGVSAFFRGV